MPMQTSYPTIRLNAVLKAPHKCNLSILLHALILLHWTGSRYASIRNFFFRRAIEHATILHNLQQKTILLLPF